jgi:hypothetical protein
MNRVCCRLAFVVVAVSGVIASVPAHAYIGPGAGLGAIGTLIALIGAVFFAIVGFVWYPIKRLMRKKQALSGAPRTPAPRATGSDAPAP